MNTQNLQAIQFLHNLGLSEEESRICFILIQEGPQTMLKLAQKSGINRTTVYRMCDELQEQGIINYKISNKSKLAEIASFEHLKQIVSNKIYKAKTLQSLLPEIQLLLGDQKQIQDTHVKFYKGEENIKQLYWNTLQAKDEILGYSFRAGEEIVGEEFYHKWLDEFVSRKLSMRDLYSDEYMKSRNKVSTYGKQIANDPANRLQSKYISSSILNVNTQMDIYNDIVAYYRWDNTEIYGVEITNKHLVTMHRQLFELAWRA